MYEAYWERIRDIFAEDPRMVTHTERVLALARHIAWEMAIPEREQRVIELSALLHDVGIVAAQRKYGSREGKYQHLEGPPVAREILEEMGEEREITERVLFIVGHHHDFSTIDGMDFQILVEADFLVNVEEGAVSRKDFAALVDRVFVTPVGKRLAQEFLGA
ncbi:HD domain-containing protein [Candidatus Caldatribacterium sp. SIUC1]|uniref:HD domain-containing protein n=1 Tax=Candidatus Caldatribacterium sp. SIUC1 TaxID=3418365 RepID=UPI003F6934D3